MTLAVGVIGAGIMGADHIATLHRGVKGAASRPWPTSTRPGARGRAAAPGAAVAADAAALIADPAVEASRGLPRQHPRRADDCRGAGRASRCCARSRWPRPWPSANGSWRQSAVRAGRSSRWGSCAASTPPTLPCDPYGRAATSGRRCSCTASAARRLGTSTSSETSITGAAIHEFDTVPWLLDCADHGGRLARAAIVRRGARAAGPATAAAAHRGRRPDHRRGVPERDLRLRRPLRDRLRAGNDRARHAGRNVADGRPAHALCALSARLATAVRGGLPARAAGLGRRALRRARRPLATGRRRPGRPPPWPRRRSPPCTRALRCPCARPGDDLPGSPRPADPGPDGGARRCAGA